MDALMQSLQEKAGLTADQAKAAASHAIEYFKSRLPAVFHEHLDAAAMGETIKTKGAELFAEAKTRGGDFLHAAQDKISGFMHTGEREV